MRRSGTRVMTTIRILDEDMAMMVAVVVMTTKRSSMTKALAIMSKI